VTTTPTTAPIAPATAAVIAEACRILGAGRLVAIPTETVYGLAADATNDHAVARIFEAKGRPHFNPLIVHYASTDSVRRDVEWDDAAARLAGRFWPGPLTFVLRRRADCRIALLASAGLDTLAVRVPDHAIARAVIESFGLPLAAPSANRSGEVSPTTAAHVWASMGRSVDLIIDGGPCRVGVESTVLDLSAAPPVILRPGGVPREAIEAIMGPVGEDDSGIDDRPRSPGRMLRHYATARPLRLEARDVRGDEALLAFGPEVPRGARSTLNLSPARDLVEAAANLFAMLRALDRPDHAAIAVMPIPDAGLGRAINDRLRRAAEP
jgi:L-threonylcarbamoyladenylate synthase